MPSFDAPGEVPVVNKKNISLRNQGGALVTTSGLLPQTGPTSVKTSTIHETQGHDRAAADFGTQADRVKTQYSTVNLGVTKKTTTSDDSTLASENIKTTLGGPVPTAQSQPEIRLRSVSQRSTYNTGAKIVIRDSNHDQLIDRKSNTGERPGP